VRVSDSYNDMSGVSEAVLMKKALKVEAGDVFPRTEGTVCVLEGPRTRATGRSCKIAHGL
jgi:hypothetical protein